MIPKPTDWMILAMMENGDKYLKMKKKTMSNIEVERKNIQLLTCFYHLYKVAIT